MVENLDSAVWLLHSDPGSTTSRLWDLGQVPHLPLICFWQEAGGEEGQPIRRLLQIIHMMVVWTRAIAGEGREKWSISEWNLKVGLEGFNGKLEVWEKESNQFGCQGIWLEELEDWSCHLLQWVWLFTKEHQGLNCSLFFSPWFCLFCFSEMRASTGWQADLWDPPYAYKIMFTSLQVHSFDIITWYVGGGSGVWYFRISPLTFLRKSEPWTSWCLTVWDIF